MSCADAHAHDRDWDKRVHQPPQLVARWNCAINATLLSSRKSWESSYSIGLSGESRFRRPARSYSVRPEDFSEKRNKSRIKSVRRPLGKPGPFPSALSGQPCTTFYQV